MTEAKPFYKLGHAVFTVTHDDPDFEPVLKRLLPHWEDESIDRTQICDIQMGLSFDIGECLRQIVNQHQACLLIQAATAISPTGQKVLISGAPNSGKSTLALALAFGYGWKVVSEDMTLINFEENEIISFGAPFNLKPGTRDVLRDAEIAVPGFILREWCPVPTELLSDHCHAKFDLSVVLDGSATDGELNCRRNTISEHVRKIMPISNLLSVRGTEKFMQYLPEDSCYLIAKGSITERLQRLVSLCAASNGEQSTKLV